MARGQRQSQTVPVRGGREPEQYLHCSLRQATEDGQMTCLEHKLTCICDDIVRKRRIMGRKPVQRPIPTVLRAHMYKSINSIQN
jgi:hypothetical protein